ncbi:MAG: hypothetical protein R3D30_07935 [Hyphomicrobiales bacterium]
MTLEARPRQPVLEACGQSAGTAGILAALEAGLAITILPEFNLPPTRFGLSGQPPLPDFGCPEAGASGRQPPSIWPR